MPEVIMLAAVVIFAGTLWAWIVWPVRDAIDQLDDETDELFARSRTEPANKVDRINQLDAEMSRQRAAVDACQPHTKVYSERFTVLCDLVDEFICLHDYPQESYAADLLYRYGMHGAAGDDTTYAEVLQRIMKYRYGRRQQRTEDGR